MLEVVFFKLIAILISVLILALAFLNKKIVGAWINPGSIFCLFWFMYTILPLLIVFNASINPVSIGYIFLFCLFFSLPSLLFSWQGAFRKNMEKPCPSTVFDSILFRKLYYLVVFFTILFIILGMLAQGFKLVEMLYNPLGIAGKFAGMRYGSELVNNFYSQAGLQGAYISVITGGLLFGATNKNKLLILILSFIPSLLVMSLQSAKGLFFLSISLFYSGVLICRIYRQDYNFITKKNIMYASVLSVLIMPIILFSFLARGLQDASYEQIIDKLYLYLVSYSSGHLYAFSDWFSQRYFDFSKLDYDQETLTGGFYTFMSFFRLFGDTREVPMGIYSEYFNIGNVLKSNIYTMYRGAISDFTLIGSLFFAAFIGFISSFSFYRLLFSNFNPVWISVFCMFMGLAYQSYIISSLIWMSLPFVFFLTVLLLYFIKLTADLGGESK